MTIHHQTIYSLLIILLKIAYALALSRKISFLFKGDTPSAFLASFIAMIGVQVSSIITLSAFHSMTGARFATLSVSALIVLYILASINYQKFGEKTQNKSENGVENKLTKYITLFCILLMVFVVAVRNSFIPDLNWDAVTYGYPRLSIWLHYRSVFIEMPSQQNAIFIDEWLGEFLGLPYALITRSMASAMFGQTESYIIYAVSIYLICKRFSNDRVASVCTTLMICSTPSVLGLAASYKGDLLAAAGVVICAFWASSIKETRHPVLIFCLTAWSAAIATGAKLSAFGPSALFTILALYYLWRHHREKAARAVALALPLSSILMSRYFLNLFHYHNPVIRPDSESSQTGISIDKFLDNMGIIIEHLTKQESANSDFFCLSAGFGFSGIILSILFASDYMKNKAERGAYMALTVAAISTSIMMSIIWAQPWSFRYFLPGISILIAVIGSISTSGFIKRRPSLIIAAISIIVSYANLDSINRNGQFIGWRGIENSIERYEKSSTLEFINNRQFRPDIVDAFSLDDPKGKSILMSVELDRESLNFVGSAYQNEITHISSTDQAKSALEKKNFDLIVFSFSKRNADKIPYNDMSSFGYNLKHIDDEYAIFSK